jgi:hypothetical protein
MGGAPSVKNLKRVGVREQFLFLAQLQAFQLFDYLANPPGPVRTIE